jgi:hypothetical protein
LHPATLKSEGQKRKKVLNATNKTKSYFSVNIAPRIVLQFSDDITLRSGIIVSHTNDFFSQPTDCQMQV